MKKILVIEDEQSVRSNILKILKFESFEAIGAENGVVGVELAQAMRPDLILCDIMMPEMDGYSVRNQLCQDPVTKIIPFIFLTAKTDRTDIRLAMSLGADDYLTKPFSRDELLDAIIVRLDKQTGIQHQFQEKLEKIRVNIATSLPSELFIPLQQVRSFLESLQSEKIDPSLLSAAKQTHESSLRLEKILQNFLLFALLEITFKDPLQAAAFKGQSKTEWTDIIHKVAQEKAKEYGRDQDLVLNIQPATIPILEANIAKIAEELLDNAFKFSTPETPVHIWSSSESDYLKIQISNHGQRLNTQELKELGAYVQFGHRLSGMGGAGLGLSIAKRLVELHDGLLEINSVQSRSTIVDITLPLAS